MCERLQRKDITNVMRSFIAGDRSVVQSLISQSATLPEIILCQAVMEGDGGSNMSSVSVQKLAEMDKKKEKRGI